MPTITYKFLGQLSYIAPDVEATIRECQRYWAPEDPPITEIYSEVGKELVKIMHEAEQFNRSRIANLIETGTLSDDNDLSTAVATGLIEALANEALETGIWNELRETLLPTSRKHADAWLSDE